MRMNHCDHISHTQPCISQRYIESHKAMKLDQEPNFDYLGQPLNSYFLIRHVAMGWGDIRRDVFQAENATRNIFGRYCLH